MTDQHSSICASGEDAITTIFLGASDNSPASPDMKARQKRAECLPNHSPF